MQHRYKIAAVTVIALFVDLLDLTIVNLAVPEIQKDFGQPISVVQWAVIGYVLAVGISMPLSGWASDRFGAKNSFLIALSIFTIGSAACGLVPSIHWLIFARSFQGLGGGLLVPIGMAILFRAFPVEQRALASAIFSVPAAIAPALGPFIGGMLVGSFGWASIFWINVPVGIIGIGLGVLWLEGEKIDTSAKLDVGGFLLGAGAFVSLIFGLSHIAESATMGASVVAPLVLGIGLLTAFVVFERKKESPLADLGLFRKPNFSAGVLTMFLASIGFGGLLFVLPLFLYDQLGFSAQMAGRIMAVHACGIIVSTAFGLKVVGLIGIRVSLLVALVGTTVALAAIALLGETISLPLFIAILFFAGMFFGLMIIPLQSAPFEGVEPERLAHGTSMLSIVRQLGVAGGTAIVAIPIAMEDQVTGFFIAFLLAGLVTLLAIPAVIKLPSSNAQSRSRDQQSAYALSGHEIDST